MFWSPLTPNSSGDGPGSEGEGEEGAMMEMTVKSRVNYKGQCTGNGNQPPASAAFDLQLNIIQIKLDKIKMH